MAYRILLLMKYDSFQRVRRCEIVAPIACTPTGNRYTENVLASNDSFTSQNLFHTHLGKVADAISSVLLVKAP